MQSAGMSWPRLCRRALVRTAVVLLGHSLFIASAQQPQPGAPAGDISNIPKSITDTVDRIGVRNPNAPRVGQNAVTKSKEDSCLLPPLTLISSPTISVKQLHLSAGARRQYRQACSTLRKGQVAQAEKHLRKAVEMSANYPVAWVTLGQVLAAQARHDEAHNACAQALQAESSYVPAYLCLADLASRRQSWDEVLKLSTHVLELDPANDAIAYEFHAAANLRLGNLASAEKSALRAADIDRGHHEPRVFFVLAQIYEAKGDKASEAAQLREFLRYATDSRDTAAVKQYLATLEQQLGVTYQAAAISAEVPLNLRSSSAPLDTDDVVPPVSNERACPLPAILKETSRRAQDFIENLQRFSANERIEQIDFDKRGKTRSGGTQVVNYVATVEANSSGYPAVKEFRFSASGLQRQSLMDTGTAAFALIFHPVHANNFNFRCEGLSDLHGVPAWQLHFEEGSDPAKAFHAFKVGASIYLPRIKGRAWIAADNYEVVRIETDLVSPIPQVNLEREHLVISYAPVEFQNHQLRLWLPENASVDIVFHGHRHQRVHNFTRFQIFSVDSQQAIKEPPAAEDKFSRWAQSRQ